MFGTGIRCGSIIQRNVRIAYQTDVTDEEEAVQLIVQRSGSSFDKDTEDCLRENVKYGAGKPQINDYQTKEAVSTKSGAHSF
jgi:hypothetical protein